MREKRDARLFSSDPTSPNALAVAAEIERQYAIVERAVKIVGWPVRMPEPKTKERRHENN
jgi:hypothetical protein